MNRIMCVGRGACEIVGEDDVRVDARVGEAETVPTKPSFPHTCMWQECAGLGVRRRGGGGSNTDAFWQSGLFPLAYIHAQHIHTHAGVNGQIRRPSSF